MADPAAFILDGGAHGAISVWYPDGPSGMAILERIDNEKGKQLVVGYRVEDDDRIAARTVLRGGTVYGGPGIINRTLPHSIDWDEPIIPPAVAPTKLWCQDVSTSPGGPLRASAGAHVSNPPVHTDANLKVTYTSRKYQLLSDASAGGNEMLRYIDYPPPKVCNRTRTAKGATWKWADLGPPPVVAVDATFIPDCEVEWAIRALQWPIDSVNWDTIRTYMNSTNTVPFSRYAFPAGTAVFSGFGLEDITLPNGMDGANLTFLFTTKQHLANEFPDPKRGFRYFPLVANDASGNKPHPERDLRDLFVPA